MNNKYLVALSFILVVGAALFYDQIWAIFSGMSVLESMKFIVTFILHVTVGTICAYVLFGLPEIIKPWVRLLRQKRKVTRKMQKTGIQQTPFQPQRAPTTNRILAYLLNQLGVPEKQQPAHPSTQEPPSHINLDL